MSVAQQELAGCLRSWRERLTPVEAGLPAGNQRRVLGLRREEVAQLAGVSVDYLARLEQGRAQRPSPSVLVVDAAGEIVAANPLASALIGDLSSASRRERNVAWRQACPRASSASSAAEEIARGAD
jgi:transcriptional regulator with XRE-family HTH domain